MKIIDSEKFGNFYFQISQKLSSRPCRSMSFETVHRAILMEMNYMLNHSQDFENLEEEELLSAMANGAEGFIEDALKLISEE